MTRVQRERAEDKKSPNEARVVFSRFRDLRSRTLDVFSNTSRYKENAPIENRNGVLHIGGSSAVELAETHGTPLYVYNEDRIRANYRRVVEAFKRHYEKFSLFYAVKANNSLAVLRILQQEGAGADVSGPTESYLAVRAGFDPQRMLYSGNYHTNDELVQGIRAGIKINLDGISQMRRIIELGLRPEFISFRINPGIGKGGHEDQVYAGPNVKFGIKESEALEAYRMAKEYGIRRFGVHMMTGSNILDENYFETITGILMDIVGRIAKGLSIKFDFVDIGGGLGVPYKPEDNPLNVELVAKKVVERFKQKVAEQGLPKDIVLMMEPGRYLVCDAGVLLARVHSIKEADKIFIGTDAGMNTLLRPAIYGAYHPILLAGDLEAEYRKEVTIVGQICENTDHLARDRLMPVITEGDLLAVLNVGAYGFAMSSQYNTRPRAAEVLVASGQHELIRERETFEDIERRMVVPERLK